MAKFDRYMLSQLMVLFGFFSLILVLIYWINRAVILFDQLIADGQSAAVFMEFTALSLPNVIRLVLPMSGFAAAVYVTNRLASESELTVMQATGFSPWRLARPVLVFGLIIGALMSMLTHILVPASIAELNQREREITNNITQRMLVEGTFLHPARGITFYIREITAQGELRDVFLSDARSEGSRVTYTAERAFLVRSESGPKLVMLNGVAQTLEEEGQRLFTTNFNDFSYDIAALINATSKTRREVKELSTTELLFPTEGLLAETRSTPGRFLQEAHGRISQPLLALVAALVGFATLLTGGYSRFGVWRQVVAAIGLLILIKLVESGAADAVRREPMLWPLIYAPALVGAGLVLGLLWSAGRPGLLLAFRRRRAA